MSTPYINGKRHSWSSIKINFLGRTVTGIEAIAYDDNVDKANNHGAGQHVVSRGEGNYTAKCKIKLHKYEVDAILASIPTKRLQSIPEFDIVVAYVAKGQDLQRIDIVRNCEFMNSGVDVKQGDTVIAVEYELIVSHIDWGGTTIDV